MEQAVLERMIRAGKLSTEDVLRQTPLEEAVALLRRHRPAKDICQALTARIAKAPLETSARSRAFTSSTAWTGPASPASARGAGHDHSGSGSMSLASSFFGVLTRRLTG
jgi:hypothetical protein